VCEDDICHSKISETRKCVTNKHYSCETHILGIRKYIEKRRNNNYNKNGALKVQMATYDLFL
jgi:hypothetical protein